MKTYLQVEYACSEVTEEDGLQRGSLDIQSLIAKSTALFSGRVTKALNLCSGKRP